MKKVITLSLLLVVLYSCKKDDNKPAGNAAFLTSGTWSLTDVVSDDDGDGTYEINDFQDFEACYTDNIYTFKSDGKLDLNEGPTKCDPSDPDNETGSWLLSNNDTNLTLGNGTFVDTYEVISITSTSLVLKQALTTNRSSKITFTKN